MLEGLEVEQLRRKLEVRYQVALYSRIENIDGGDFDALRPSGFENGNGFSILLSRTHRQFEASFKADNFAGALLRVMSEVNDVQKSGFIRAKSAAECKGAQVYAAINGRDDADCLDVKERWTRVEIDVSRRFASGKNAEDILETSFQATSTCLSLVLILAGIDGNSLATEDSAVKGLPEGAKLQVEVNRYERSPVNRAACIEHYGLQCQCCGFSFQHNYGELGEGYIEVHHRTPVSKMGEDYVVDPIADLVPICSNCHSMVHRTDPPTLVEELRELVAAHKDATHQFQQ